MRTIIAGSRTLGLAQVISAMRKCGWRPTVVLSGAARGVDQAGETWAASEKIPVELFPAKWKEYGRSAGMIRNAVMAMHADALVAVWDGKSRGTENMIHNANTRGLKVFVYRTDKK